MHAGLHAVGIDLERKRQLTLEVFFPVVVVGIPKVEMDDDSLAAAQRLDSCLVARAAAVDGQLDVQAAIGAALRVLVRRYVTLDAVDKIGRGADIRIGATRCSGRAF